MGLKSRDEALAYCAEVRGKGERLQYPDGKGDSVFGPGPSYPSVREHNALDKGLSLVGDWVGRWFVWDGMRALDVLLAQEGVDPARIGVTGSSGGGTMSVYAFACDYRGIGESRPDTCNPDSFHDIYGCDYEYASHATMFGESYVAWRVHDVLSTLDWMASFGYDEVPLVARGNGAIPGALAALLDDRIERVTLRDAPKSLAALVADPMNAWPFSALLPGALTAFDLPDLYRALGGKCDAVRWTGRANPPGEPRT